MCTKSGKGVIAQSQENWKWKININPICLLVLIYRFIWYGWGERVERWYILRTTSISIGTSNQMLFDPKSFHLISIQSWVTAFEVLLWRFYSLCCHKNQIKSFTVHFLDVLSQLYGGRAPVHSSQRWEEESQLQITKSEEGWWEFWKMTK